MSYKTEDDENWDKAKEHIQAAINCLSKLVIDRVDDWQHYSHEGKKKVMDTFLTLFQLNQSLED